MLPGINPAQMQGMMKKMGISQTPLNVNRVIFEMEDGNLVIDEPSVLKIMMQGQETYQVSGEAKEMEDETESFNQEDIQMVISQTGKNEDEVKQALEKTEGDIAEAIIALKE
jgi:nascent polypeptide-associated complex subunit alpha